MRAGSWPPWAEGPRTRVLPFATMSRATLLLVSVIAALMLQGCGIKGPLQPPSEQPAKKQQPAPAP